MLSSRILQPFIKTHTPTLARVIESMVILGQIVHLSEILIFQFALKRTVILLDKFSMTALGNHARTTSHTPNQRHLRRRAVTLLSDGLDDFVVEELWRLAWRVRRIGASEGRVACDMDAVVFVPFEPVPLLQVRVEFHLVHGGMVGGVLYESL